MARAPKRDPKREALARDGALNLHPEAIHDASFTGNPFFDAKDLVQVRYEMVRRHRVDGVAISEVSTNFGVSRPTFYVRRERRDFPVGDRPTRQLSLRPVAIGAVVEVTKRLKPLV